MTTLPHWAVCFWHSASEVQTVDSYKVCAECYHVWQTEDEFWIDMDVMAIELGQPPWPRDLLPYYCPLCSHDF